MRTLVLMFVIAFFAFGAPLIAMNVPSEGPPAEETPVQSGGYYTQGELILITVCVTLLVLMII